jgi:hypothetical protein
MWLTIPAGGELAVSDGPICEARREGFELLDAAGTADRAFPIPEPAMGPAAGFLLTNFSPMTSY